MELACSKLYGNLSWWWSAANSWNTSSSKMTSIASYCQTGQVGLLNSQEQEKNYLVLRLWAFPIGMLPRVMMTMTTLAANHLPPQCPTHQITIKNTLSILTESPEDNLGTCCTNDLNPRHLKSLWETPTRHFSANSTAVVIDPSANNDDQYLLQTYPTTNLCTHPAILSSPNSYHNDECPDYKMHLNKNWMHSAILADGMADTCCTSAEPAPHPNNDIQFQNLQWHPSSCQGQWLCWLQTAPTRNWGHLPLDGTTLADRRTNVTQTAAETALPTQYEYPIPNPWH